MRAGDLGLTFGGDGKVTTDFGDNVNRIDNRAHAVAVQPDGKIVAAGYATGANDDFAVTRYNADGTLDTTFSSDGKVRTDFLGNEDRANAVAIQPDGKIVVVGYAQTGTNLGTVFAVVRYTADGTLDTSFSGDGKVTTNILTEADKAEAVVVQSDGKIVVAGNTLTELAIARYNADGTLDTSFRGNGKFQHQYGSGDRGARAVALQGDKIVVAGYSNTGGFLVARFNASGSSDATFGSSGKTETSFGSATTAHAMAIQGDGKIVVAGNYYSGAQEGGNFVLARYDADGALDTSFGSGGNVTADFGGTDDTAYGLAIQDNGKIVVAGEAHGNFGVARFTSWGAPDTSFGSLGKVITDFGGNDHGRGMALLPDGNIVVAGYSQRGSNTDFAVARYVGRGAPLADASLSALDVTQGPNANAVSDAALFRPTTFSQFRTGYTALLAAGTTHVKVTPTASDVNATIFVTGGGQRQQVYSGRSSTAIPIAGFSRIEVEVTAQDGKTQQTYTVDLKRAAGDATLTGLTARYQTGSSYVPLIFGEFDPKRTSYSAAVPYQTGHSTSTTPNIRLTPTLDVASSSVTVNGTSVASGSAHGVTLDPGDNVIRVRVRSGDGTVTRDYTLTVKRLPPGVTEWGPELRSKDLGGGRFGCRNGVAGAGCSDSAVLSESRFNVNRAVYSYADTTGYRVQELSFEQLAVYARETDYRIVFTVESDWTVDLKPMTLVLSVGGTEYRLPFSGATRSNHGRTFTWRQSIEPLTHDWGHKTTYRTVTARIEANATGLDTVRVYYDGTHVVFDQATRILQPKRVEGFRRWDVARAKPYDSSFVAGWYGDRAHIAVIPGEFVALNAAQGKVTTTHAKLRLAGTAPGSHVEYAKTAFGRPPPSSGWTWVDSGGFTEAIELDAASKNTYVSVRVTNGNQTATHLVIIDPPPRTYKVNPEVTVTEGDEATVTVSLGSPATRGGVTFEVTAAYGEGGATADDVGEIVSTVTVPEGQRSVSIAVPTVDDDAVEDDESFTVSVSHVGTPAWAVEPGKTATATVTIANDDEPPPGPEPWNIEVTPGDGTLTVTWNVSSREGYDDSEVWHALRWFQPYGGPHRWDNPRDRRAVGRNDGLSVDPGVNSYTITGLTNGVATDVFVRSMVGHRNNMSERLADSSKWVKATGDTTPVAPPNEAPTVAYGIADVTIASESGTGEVTLSGVFADADGDGLTVTAVSSDENVAAVSVSADYSTLTVNANARGTAVVTVTADDGSGGSVQDSFTVTVKAAPTVASAIADVSELQIDATHGVSLPGVFSDPDGDALTVSATSSDNAVATVTATIDPVTASTTALTVIATGEGTATVTVTARDSDGNSVSDTFDVTVPAPEVQPLQEAQPLQQQAATLPGAVTDLTLTANGDSVTVSWRAPASGAVPTRYIVHLKPDGGDKGSGKTKRPKAPKTQVTYKNLEPGTTYNVWVRAQNKTGKGERTHATITLPTPQPQ